MTVPYKAGAGRREPIHAIAIRSSPSTHGQRGIGMWDDGDDEAMSPDDGWCNVDDPGGGTILATTTRTQLECELQVEVH